MSKKRLMLVTVLSVIGVILLAIGSSYALFTFNVTKNSNFKAIVGNLELSISDTNSEDRIVLNNLEPKKDSVALTEDGYTFTITNTGSVDAFYTVYLDDIIPTGETKERISDSMMKVNLSEVNYVYSYNTKKIGDLSEKKLTMGVLHSGDSITYQLRLWLDYDTDNSNQNKYYASRIRIDSVQEKTLKYDTPDKILLKFKPSELSEVVMCDEYDGIYENCSPYTLEGAIETRNTGTIILANDLIKSEAIVIPENKNLKLELNDKKIILNSDNSFMNIQGELSINENGKRGTIKGYIYVYRNASLEINGGNIINENKDTIYNLGTLVINNGIISNSSDIPLYNRNILIINGGTFESGSSNSLSNQAIATINGGTFVSNSGVSIANSRELTINGGVIRSNSNAAISNSGELVIDQSDEPLHISSGYSENGWGGCTINNTSTMNINANVANACTDDSNDTTVGLCVYDSNENAITSNGSLNIKGGTYISANDDAIWNNMKMGICDAKISGKRYDVYNNSALNAKLYYNNVTFSDGLNTSASTRIYNSYGGATATESDTCPIVFE